MRESRKEHLLPLQVGVPYKMANGERVVFDCIEDIAFNGYDLATGQHNTNGFDLDITEFYIEDGFWRVSRDGMQMLVLNRHEREPDNYPFTVYDVNTSEFEAVGTITKDGYHFNDSDCDTALGMDIIGYVKPVSKEEIENFKWFRARLLNREYVVVERRFPIAWNTGAHVSTTEPDLLAYFPTQKHWDNRVPQKIKAGRYLRKYFPDMGDDEIRQKANLLTGGHRTLKVLTHWHDMYTAYRELDISGIVSSCMSKSAWHPLHPLMVYHESDVQLVVMYEGDEPKARALVNKETKEFPMIYGQWERMLPMLEAAGYTHGSLDGAEINKLQRFPSDADWDTLKGSVESIRTTDMTNLLMPYIDGHRDHSRSCNNASSVYIRTNYCEIYQHGDFEANSYDDAVINDVGRHTCDMCEDPVDESEMNYLDTEGVSCCNHCYDRHTVRVVTYYSATRGEEWDRVSYDYAEYNYLYIGDTWYVDSDVAEEAGWVWSDYHGDWRDKSNCIQMHNGDWVDADLEGIVFELDEIDNEYKYIPSPRTDSKTQDIVDHTIALAA